MKKLFSLALVFGVAAHAAPVATRPLSNKIRAIGSLSLGVGKLAALGTCVGLTAWGVSELKPLLPFMQGSHGVLSQLLINSQVVLMAAGVTLPMLIFNGEAILGAGEDIARAKKLWSN